MSAKTSASEVAEAVGEAMYARDIAAQSLGITLEEIRPGYARMTMPVRPDMINGHDLGHGGFTFALADTAFAYACNSYNQISVAHIAEITFIAGARNGDQLIAEAEERAFAGRSGVFDVTVTNQTGDKIALFRGHSRSIKGTVVPDLPTTR
ncbi:MAG: hydroxyphenylacetyl-CoA thioesterase PaaI [Minwuiales bacterium]|nr:hydroxyphenylacetyl-CoA thioesterase PaaI [Minwuiales bacterium]